MIPLMHPSEKEERRWSTKFSTLFGLNKLTITLNFQNSGVLQLGLLLSGAVLTETIYAWNGLGSYVVNAVNARDFPVIQGCVLIFAFTFVLINLLVDMSYFGLDPRIREKGV